MGEGDTGEEAGFPRGAIPQVTVKAVLNRGMALSTSQ